jgi:hypothetical protein
METIKQMEDRWLVLMAARDPKTNERIAERDLHYAAECQALRVQIEERKAAETARPQISAEQLRQLEWLDRLQGARLTKTTWDAKTGKATTEVLGRAMDDPSPRGSQFRENVEQARIRVYAGQALTAEQIAATEANITAQGVALPAPTVRLEPTLREKQLAAEGAHGPGMPPPHHYAPLLQATSTRQVK